MKTQSRQLHWHPTTGQALAYGLSALLAGFLRLLSINQFIAALWLEAAMAFRLAFVLLNRRSTWSAVSIAALLRTALRNFQSRITPSQTPQKWPKPCLTP
jgi:hypothetical protein